MNIEFQVISNGNTIFMAPFTIDDEHQLADNSKVAMKAFSHAHPDLSVLEDDLIIMWRLADSTSVAEVRLPEGTLANKMSDLAGLSLRWQ
jgi:hypothetical protein